MKLKLSAVVLALALLSLTACEKVADTKKQAGTGVKAVRPQTPAVIAKPVAAKLLILDDFSDSPDKDEARPAKEKFLVGLSGVRFLHITLVRFGRGNLNAGKNNFDFSLPSLPAQPQPEYELLGPVGKTNKALRLQKEQEAAALYQELTQAYEDAYQAAFKKFEETFLNPDDALKTKADACVNAASLRERLADEAANASAETLAVIFSDGQFCKSDTAAEPLTVKTAVVLYAALSAEAEGTYQKQLAQLFPNAQTVKGVQADHALNKLMDTAEVVWK